MKGAGERPRQNVHIKLSSKFFERECDEFARFECFNRDIKLIVYAVSVVNLLGPNYLLTIGTV